MEDTIIVRKREQVGKVETKRLRAEGMIPATVYGLGEPAISVAIDPKVVARVISSEHGINSVIYMQREGTDIKRHVIIKDVQRDPVTRRLVHVDFLRVDPTHKVKVTVPIVLKGNPIGVKEGGTLEFVHRDITVECLPAFIPSNITVNVSAMKQGETMRLDQVELDPHLTLHGDVHNVICAIHGKKVEETPAEEAAPAAPAKKGKK